MMREVLEPFIAFAVVVALAMLFFLWMSSVLDAATTEQRLHRPVPASATPMTTVRPSPFRTP